MFHIMYNFKLNKKNILASGCHEFSLVTTVTHFVIMEKSVNLLHAFFHLQKRFPFLEKTVYSKLYYFSQQHYSAVQYRLGIKQNCTLGGCYISILSKAISGFNSRSGLGLRCMFHPLPQVHITSLTWSLAVLLGLHQWKIHHQYFITCCVCPITWLRYSITYHTR